jgi:hypothetical protein
VPIALFNKCVDSLLKQTSKHHFDYWQTVDNNRQTSGESASLPQWRYGISRSCDEWNRQLLKRRWNNKSIIPLHLPNVFFFSTAAYSCLLLANFSSALLLFQRRFSSCLFHSSQLRLIPYLHWGSEADSPEVWYPTSYYDFVPNRQNRIFKTFYDSWICN